MPQQKRAKTIWIAQMKNSSALAKTAVVCVSSDWLSYVNYLDLKCQRKKAYWILTWDSACCQLQVPQLSVTFAFNLCLNLSFLVFNINKDKSTNPFFFLFFFLICQGIGPKGFCCCVGDAQDF